MHRRFSTLQQLLRDWFFAVSMIDLHQPKHQSSSVSGAPDKVKRRAGPLGVQLPA